MAGIDDLEESFPGFALEGGFAYMLGRHFELPLFVTATFKYQYIEDPDPFVLFDRVVIEGASEVLPIKEIYYNSNFAVFYVFDF